MVVHDPAGAEHEPRERAFLSCRHKACREIGHHVVRAVSHEASRKAGDTSPLAAEPVAESAQLLDRVRSLGEGIRIGEPLVPLTGNLFIESEDKWRLEAHDGPDSPPGNALHRFEYAPRSCPEATKEGVRVCGGERDTTCDREDHDGPGISPCRYQSFGTI